jgi:hypothetical protein
VLVIVLSIGVGASLPLLRRVPPVGVADVLLVQAAAPMEGQVEEVQRLRQQVRLARLPVVERAAVDAAGATGPGVLRVVLVPDRAALRFSFEHPDEQAARRGALAAVAAYDEVRIRERRQRALADLRRTDAALRATAVAGAVQDEALRQALADRRARLLVLRDSRDGLTLLTAEIERPHDTTPLRGGLAGAVAGLFPAVFFAHRAARRGIRLRRPEAVTAVLGVPGLAVLERLRPGRAASSDSPLGVAYSVAAEALLLLDVEAGTQVVAVVGAGAGDRSVSTVTADLARALLRSSRRVCVIGSGPAGAVDLLSATSSRPAGDETVGRLSLVHAEPGAEWPDLRDVDVVLVDAPEAGTRASALEATSRAGSALVVAHHRVTREELAAVLQRLARVQVRPVGHLQVRPRRRRSLLPSAATRLRRRRRRLVTSPLLATS